MPWPQTGANQYHAQLGLPVKGLVVCKSDIEPLDPQNGLALGCYQPVLEVLFEVVRPSLLLLLTDSSYF